MARVAMCTVCEEQPLVTTFAWSHFEFYCVNCGGHFGWLDPEGAEETPELLEKMEAVKAEFETLGGSALLGGGLMRRDCEKCKAARFDEPHREHATPEEIAAHEAALERLAERASAGARAG